MAQALERYHQEASALEHCRPLAGVPSILPEKNKSAEKLAALFQSRERCKLTLLCPS